MAEPFIGEVRVFSFGFAPQGWAQCNGQLLPINQNQALFSLLGTTFGGNGQTNFALPDLQGRTPIHVGQGFVLGQSGGEQTHTLSSAELPAHTHAFQGATNAADQAVATGNLLAAASNVYTSAANLTSLHPGTVTTVGGSQSHENMQPYLTLIFSIALQGIFPSPN